MLAEIIAHKKKEIALLNTQVMRRAAENSPEPRNFLSAIQGRPIDRHPALIAEIKYASPSRGVLTPHIDPFQIMDIYTENGAAAISVLTDEKYFMGNLETLAGLRFSHNATLPLLRKDFILNQAQLYESRANGADAVLLIAAVLTDDGHFADLHTCALNLGLTVLVEVHNLIDLERALEVDDVCLIGINNRNLANFEVSLQTTEQLRALIPDHITVVSESGIFSSRDVSRLTNANVDAILVGEALVTAEDIGEKVRELSGLEMETP